MLRQYTFGQEALEWVEYSLRYGNALANKLLTLPLAEGRITSFLPVSVEERFFHQFEWGGVARQESVRTWLTPFIESYLSAKPDRYAIFETDEEAQDVKEWTVEERIENHLIYKHEVYYFASSGAPTSFVSDAHGYSRQYPTVGVLTQGTEETRIQYGDCVDDAQLELLALNCDHILIGAWDEEGTLVWSRPNGEPV